MNRMITVLFFFLILPAIALAGTAGIFDGIPGMVAVKGNYINNMPDSEISYRKTTGARYATKDRKNMYYSTIKYEVIK